MHLALGETLGLSPLARLINLENPPDRGVLSHCADCTVSILSHVLYVCGFVTYVVRCCLLNALYTDQLELEVVEIRGVGRAGWMCIGVEDEREGSGEGGGVYSL